MAYLASLFAHEHVRFHYVHENDPNDSMFRATTYFQEAMNKIIDTDTKSHIYKYQKDIKIRILCEREDKIEINKNIQKEKTKKEAREHAENSATSLASQPRDKGKGVFEGPSSPRLDSMEHVLQKGAGFKMNIELIRSQLQTHIDIHGTQCKKQNIQVSTR